MTHSSKGVFLSYASEDAGVAKRICDALRHAGIDVWFDQSELRGGDAWDQKIRQQIRDCALFVPIISAQTQARPEGYFRLEWKLAIDRSHLMAAEKAFLVPVVVDATTEPDALVPTQFRDVQWTRLQPGEVQAAFVERIASLLDHPVAHHVGVTERGPAARRLPLVPTALIAAMVVAIVIAIGMQGGWLSRRSVPQADTSTAPAPVASTLAAIPEKSVAVLPFVDMSEKKDQEYFSDGLTEELIDALTKVSDLRVPARTSSFYFKGKQTTIADIGRELSVAHVLEGSVRKSGKTLRVTAQLIRVSNGYHVWSQTYDRKLDDVFRVQDEIARAVVDELKVSLTSSGLPKAATPERAEAYLLFLKGRELNRLAGSKEQFETAAEYLRRAIKIDPTYAEAWACLVFALGNQIGVVNLQGATVAPEMRLATERALALNPNLSLAHAAQGTVYWFLDWDWQRAAQELQKAYDLSPNDAGSTSALAEILHTLEGATERVSGLYKKAIELDPVDYYAYQSMAVYLRSRGEFAEAETAARNALEMQPTQPYLHLLLSSVLLLRGKAAEALQEAQREPEEVSRREGMALSYFALGRRSDADLALSEMEHKDASSNPVLIAEVYSYRGEIDRAFAWLERAYQQRDFSLSTTNRNALFKNLHQDARWKAFLRKLRLPE